jgi:nucleotide-binding universal stress UspA family protein
VLVSRAERASMLVVGSGDPSSVSHQVLGSVAEYCVRHSPVPVVIVPAPARLERRAAASAQAV